MSEIREEEVRELVEKVLQTKQSYETSFGAVLYEKPEHMTHLRGNLLVFKNHPRIILRGAIDSLESELILVQIQAQKEGRQKLVEDLQQIIDFIRKLLRCELTEEPVGEFCLLGMDAAMLRDCSHHPGKYFGIRHFLPTYEKGEMVALLNRLRTLTREVEIKAFQAFFDEQGRVSREDIIRSFNRLSSLFWIMMFQYLAGQYD